MTCTVNVTDDGLGGTLTANYTWYRDGVANLTGYANVTSGVNATITLSSTYTSANQEVVLLNVT
ncbi:MAG: hypothetical protein HC945_01915, partial [Nitrosarchaeum sp.]|nr:hypothetical protein [Nitrosarchaeum sp.]